MLRQVRPRRSLATKRELRTDHPTGTDMKEDFPFQEAVDNLVPQIAARSRNAVRVDPVHVFYYQRKMTGRRCSCFLGGDTSPDGLCPVCWGTGIVGGFEKYGTRTEVLDVTAANLTMVNVHVGYELHTRPFMFVLDDTALNGYVEARIPLIQGTGALDCLQILDQVRQGNAVECEVRAATELTFVPFTRDNVTARLDSEYLVLRCHLTRADSTQRLPLLSHINMRYNLIEDLKLIADQPRNTESIALAEFGLFDNFSSIQFFFDSTYNVFNTNDFFIRLRDNKRFKVIEVQKNEPLGIATSTDVTARLVQDYDVYHRIA